MQKYEDFAYFCMDMAKSSVNIDAQCAKIVSEVRAGFFKPVYRYALIAMFPDVSYAKSARA